jgi:hypothetical protein
MSESSRRILVAKIDRGKKHFDGGMSSVPTAQAATNLSPTDFAREGGSQTSGNNTSPASKTPQSS